MDKLYRRRTEKRVAYYTAGNNISCFYLSRLYRLIWFNYSITACVLLLCSPTIHVYVVTRCEYRHIITK